MPTRLSVLIAPIHVHACSPLPPPSSACLLVCSSGRDITDGHASHSLYTKLISACTSVLFLVAFFIVYSTGSARPWIDLLGGAPGPRLYIQIYIQICAGGSGCLKPQYTRTVLPNNVSGDQCCKVALERISTRWAVASRGHCVPVRRVCTGTHHRVVWLRMWQ